MTTRTIRFTAEVDVAFGIPQEFTDAMRDMANDADRTTIFLTKLKERVGDDDEAFTEGFIRNGLRIFIRDALISLARADNLGITVAPIKATRTNPL